MLNKFYFITAVVVLFLVGIYILFQNSDVGSDLKAHSCPDPVKLFDLNREIDSREIANQAWAEIQVNKEFQTNLIEACDGYLAATPEELEAFFERRQSKLQINIDDTTPPYWIGLGSCGGIVIEQNGNVQIEFYCE